MRIHTKTITWIFLGLVLWSYIGSSRAVDIWSVSPENTVQWQIEDTTNSLIFNTDDSTDDRYRSTAEFSLQYNVTSPWTESLYLKIRVHNVTVTHINVTMVYPQQNDWIEFQRIYTFVPTTTTLIEIPYKITTTIPSDQWNNLYSTTLRVNNINSTDFSKYQYGSYGKVIVSAYTANITLDTWAYWYHYTNPTYHTVSQIIKTNRLTLTVLNQTLLATDDDLLPDLICNLDPLIPTLVPNPITSMVSSKNAFAWLWEGDSLFNTALRSIFDFSATSVNLDTNITTLTDPYQTSLHIIYTPCLTILPLNFPYSLIQSNYKQFNDRVQNPATPIFRNTDYSACYASLRSCFLYNATDSFLNITLTDSTPTIYDPDYGNVGTRFTGVWDITTGTMLSLRYETNYYTLNYQTSLTLTLYEPVTESIAKYIAQFILSIAGVGIIGASARAVHKNKRHNNDVYGEILAHLASQRCTDDDCLD